MSDQKAIDSIIEFWQQIIADDEMPVQNRMKASELLYRSLQQDKEQANAAPEQTDTTSLSERIQKAKEIIERYAKKGRDKNGA